MSTEEQPKHQRDAANFVAVTRDVAEKRLVWESRPWFLEYSTNSACNLRCIMCSQVENPPVVSTPLELQEPFLEEVSRHVTVLTPSATSEPLLNNMRRLQPLLSRNGVFLDIITNGVLLTPDLLERLLPNLHRLTLSIDSHRKEVFEKLRAPAEFERVIEHSRHAIRRCNEAGVPVVIHMVLARDCIAELPEFVDFIAELGGHSITILELLPNSPQFEELDPFAVWSDGAIDERIEAMKERGRERGVALTFETRAPWGGRFDYSGVATRIQPGALLELLHHELGVAHAGFCPQVMGYFKVEPDGRAYPCCRAPAELYLGNVFEEGVEGVWNGAPMQELRRRMFERDYPDPCKDCVVLHMPRWEAEQRRIG